MDAPVHARITDVGAHLQRDVTGVNFFRHQPGGGPLLRLDLRETQSLRSHLHLARAALIDDTPAERSSVLEVRIGDKVVEDLVIDGLFVYGTAG